MGYHHLSRGYGVIRYQYQWRACVTLPAQLIGVPRSGLTASNDLQLAFPGSKQGSSPRGGRGGSFDNDIDKTPISETPREPSSTNCLLISAIDCL